MDAEEYFVTDSESEGDINLAVCFTKKRHTESIGGLNCVAQQWRMKERMKTVSVALVLCLNVGVDPPDVMKIQPCSKLECWIDPLSVSPQKALEMIGSNLQKQYERWQPRARYKQALDPTVDVVKKLCTSLRRNAKEERVLFHYNGHGVPQPTSNGEIWVFNDTYTQYIPLSIYDLQTWMSAPSIFVYDCSNAGLIVSSFLTFADQHDKELEQVNKPPNIRNNQNSTSVQTPAYPSFKNCIQLAACGPNQILPMNPQLPADLFTACLTTPINIALKWFTLQHTSRLVPHVTCELIDRMPGLLNDRRTMLGELNWIFTAITDTIAWNTLPRDLFQRLFRQDLLVASLFRNFLLAERILRSYDCTPVSHPALPQGFRHPMWSAWDLALDFALAQLPDIISNNKPFQNSPFFEEQLTAFQVWLDQSSPNRAPPEQLPIVLQVLLSQVHRLRALELLGRFLDLGAWAVNLALSVGIFPYVLKLLQSSARELRSLLVFIWAKILAVDGSCQVDLVRDQGHKYFLSVLQDTTMTAEHRTQAAFVLATIVNNFTLGQTSALQGSLISICLEQICDNNWRLRQWLAICLGQLWHNFDKARWAGVRDLAHEKIYPLLVDAVPEVRAAAVFALGTFISSVTERSEHANNIDRSIAMNLLNMVGNDMSPIVRIELVAALQWMLIHFENQFIPVFMQEPPTTTIHNVSGINTQSLERSANIIRVSSSHNIINCGNTQVAPIGFGSIYMKIWQGLTNLCKDPHPNVKAMATQVVEFIRKQAVSVNSHKDIIYEKIGSSLSLPPSPNPRTSFMDSLSTPPQPQSHSQPQQQQLQQSPSQIVINPSQLNSVLRPQEIGLAENATMIQTPIVTSNFIEWAASYFAKPSKENCENDIDQDSPLHIDRLWRIKTNEQMKREAKEQYSRVLFNRHDNQKWIGKTQHVPKLVKLHPYELQIAVAYKGKVFMHDWHTGTVVGFTSEIPDISQHSIFQTTAIPHVSAIEFINAHDQSLMLVGYDDGTIRLWRPSDKCDKSPTLVSAWQALFDINTRKLSGGLLTSWQQRTQMLVCGGDTKMLRLWDAEKEQKINDIPTNADAPISFLSSTPDGLIVGGFNDGTVRIFDQKCNPQEARVMTYREHSNTILTACLKHNTDVLVSGCADGFIRLFDMRKNSSFKNWRSGRDLSAISFHPRANVLACGSNGINIFNVDGQQLSTIKSYEGFIGPKIVQTSCLFFHPYKMDLACGFFDKTVSVYVLDK